MGEAACKERAQLVHSNHYSLHKSLSAERRPAAMAEGPSVLLVASSVESNITVW